MDKLRAIKYFLKVSETGSFTRTAKEFGVPASSVSRRIQDLEKDLGAVLLHRSTRLVKLTELGALYLEEISPAVATIENTNEILQQHALKPSGILRVTANPGYGRFRLMPALRKLRKLYPDIVIDVELTDRLVNLSQNPVDIAIRATASPPERTVACKISNNRFVMVASPKYLKAHGVPKSLAELRAHKTLHYRGPNGPLSWYAKTVEGWEELSHSIAFISTEGEALVEEALTGFGIGLIPVWAIGAHLEAGRLIELKLNDTELSISRNDNSGIFLLYHRPKYSIRKIRAAVDFLIAELTDLD